MTNAWSVPATGVNNSSSFNCSTVSVELERDLLLAQEAGSTRATLNRDKDPRNLDRINK